MTRTPSLLVASLLLLDSDAFFTRPFFPSFSDSVSKNIKIGFTGAPGAKTPSFSGNDPKCAKLENQSPPPQLAGAPPSKWSWTVSSLFVSSRAPSADLQFLRRLHLLLPSQQTVQDAGDGIYEFVIGNVSTWQTGGSTGVSLMTFSLEGLSKRLLRSLTFDSPHSPGHCPSLRSKGKDRQPHGLDSSS